MDNTKKPINDECACSMDYEAAYHDAVKELNAVWEENKSLRIVVRELSKIISTVRIPVTVTCTKEKIHE